MLSRLDAPARAALLFAFALATALALLRPPFQLSDEVYYFATAQPVERLAQASGACRPLATRVMPVGVERRAFRRLVTPLLFHSCEATQSPAAAIHVTRVVLGLGLVIITWATWQAARLLVPARPDIASLAAAMAASQPVLATMSAGITPSAMADPLAAVTCLGLVGAATISDRSRFAWLAVAILASVVGLLAKDSLIGLAGLTLLGGPILVYRSHASRSMAWRRTALLALATIVTISVAAALLTLKGDVLAIFRRAIMLEGAADRALGAPVLIRTLAGIPAYYWSFIGNLGNFGGNQVLLPRALGWIGMALALTSVVGLLVKRHAIEGRNWRRLTTFFGVFMVVLLLQAPTQQAMLANAPALQGRWLFPGILPMALWSSVGLLSWTARADRLMPVLTTVVATIPCVALFWVVVPHYYAVFPHTYSYQGLFLRGPYGVPIDQALLAPMLGPPTWLADTRVAWLLLLWVLSSAAWMVASTHTFAARAQSRYSRRPSARSTPGW